MNKNCNNPECNKKLKRTKNKNGQEILYCNSYCRHRSSAIRAGKNKLSQFMVCDICGQELPLMNFRSRQRTHRGACMSEKRHRQYKLYILKAAAAEKSKWSGDKTPEDIISDIKSFPKLLVKKQYANKKTLSRNRSFFRPC